jgi:hypothetical protein
MSIASVMMSVLRLLVEVACGRSARILAQERLPITKYCPARERWLAAGGKVSKTGSIYSPHPGLVLLFLLLCVVLFLFIVIIVANFKAEIVPETINS